MPKMTIYFNDAAYEYVKEKGEGFVGSLVQDAMIGEPMIAMDEMAPTPMIDTSKYEEANKTAKHLVTDEDKFGPVKVIKTPEDARDLGMNKYRPEEPKDAKWYCAKCGAKLPFYGASKCKQCGTGGKKKK